MEPSFASGDRLVLNRAVFWFRDPRPGELVVLRHPQKRSQLMLKRVERVEEGRYVVLGDNPERSTDSRQFGAVERDLIIGKVRFRY